MSETVNKHQLRNISKQQYSRTVDFLAREAKSKDPDDLLKYIGSRNVKPNTRYNYLNAIISLQKADPEAMVGDLSKIYKMRDELKKILTLERCKNNLTDKQREVMSEISKDDIEDLIASLGSSKDVKDVEDYILLRLMFPEPMRNDLSEIKIVRNKQNLGKYNAIYIPTKKTLKAIVKIVDHKTSSSANAKPIVRELDLDLTNKIREFVKDKAKTNKDGVFQSYLFQDSSGKPYSSSAFSHKLERMFKKRLGSAFSSSTLRKIYWTGEHGDKYKAMKECAQNMGHALKTAQEYYIAN